MTAKPYLSQVRRHLVCSAATRRQLMDQARQMAEDFLQETPNADTAALTAAFGEPQAFAAQMLATLEPEEVETARRRKRLLRRSGVAVLILALLVVAVVYFFRWRSLREIIPEDGDFAVIGPVEYVSDEDAEKIFNDPSAIVHENHKAFIEGENIIQEGN